MGAIASQIMSLTLVYSTVYSDADQRKHQISASLAFGEFPAQMAGNAENVSIWWRHHGSPLKEKRIHSKTPGPILICNWLSKWSPQL